jgi:hypothetical protein
MLHLIEAGHNLWNRRSHEVYREVVRLEMQLMPEQIMEW